MCRPQNLFWILACFLIAFSSRAENKAVFVYPEDQEKIVSLDVEWEFYWKKLYTPSNFLNDSALKPDLLVKPSSWNDLVVNGKKCGSYGFATYRIILKNLPGKTLMLDAYSVQTASRIYLNGNLISEVGKVGENVEESEAANRDIQFIIPADLNEAELIVQISNFQHRKGGFVHPFEIGDPETILNQHQLYYLLDATESSALAIIGLFLLALYIFRRKDKSVLYFSLFCITLAFRPVISVNYLMATLMPDLNWSLMIKLEYLGVLFPCLFMVLFIRELFPAQLPKILVKLFVIVFGIKILITLFFPVSIFSWLVLPILVIIPIGILLLTITIIRAVIAKAEGANYAGLGVIVLFISLLLKVTSYSGIIPSVHVLITLMDIAFIFMMSLILGSRFSKQFVKVETLQKETEYQKLEIELKNKEITDSINYAKRIQFTLLANDNYLQQNLNEHFILFKPKDIVSGDFYWATKFVDTTSQNFDETFFLAVCDSTGHGVPGAFMSLLNISFLNEAITERKMLKPNEIFDYVRTKLIESVSQNGGKDGMDGILLSISGDKIYYASANNSSVLISNGNITELNKDKMPVGFGEKKQNFGLHEIIYQKGDMLYLYTDGFADQFGGERAKKYKYKQLNQLLASISDLPMEEQKIRLEKEFYRWKGDLEQVDDVCVIGIKL